MVILSFLIRAKKGDQAVELFGQLQQSLLAMANELVLLLSVQALVVGHCHEHFLVLQGDVWIAGYN